MIYYRLENFYKKFADIAARNETNPIKDKIYFSCYKKTLENNFSQSEIRSALKNGWIKEAHIQKEGQIFKIYMWLDIELKQRRLFPSLIESFTNFVNNYIVLPLMRLTEKD